MNHDDVRSRLERYTGATGGSQAYLAHRLAADARVLLAEVDQMRGQLDAIRALHTDSPAGVCPSCYRLHDASDTDDGLVDWPCPTLRAMGVEPALPHGATA